MLIGVDFSADTLGSVTAGATAEIENQCRRTDHLSRHNRAHLWFTKRSWSGSIAVELHVRLFLLRHSEATRAEHQRLSDRARVTGNPEVMRLPVSRAKQQLTGYRICGRKNGLSRGS